MGEQLQKFHTIGDERGYLVSLEENRNIPFSIKRVYYIYGTNDQPRGFHAHKELQQMLVCVSGSCKVKLDDGKNQSVFALSTGNEGLLVDKMIWHEMYDFSVNCVLLVLASEYYEEDDYIRDYNLFLEEMISIKFVDFNEEILNLSKKWLTDPETKELTMTPNIDEKTQLIWFKSLSHRTDYYIKGIVYENQSIGAMGIKNITPYCGEYWGYIGEKQYWGKKLGKYLIGYAVREAKLLNLEYLYLKVNVNNDRAIKLYEKSGFKMQFVENNIMYMIKNIGI